MSESYGTCTLGGTGHREIWYLYIAMLSTSLHMLLTVKGYIHLCSVWCRAGSLEIVKQTGFLLVLMVYGCTIDR